jgi:hypothetical protein
MTKISKNGKVVKVTADSKHVLQSAREYWENKGYTLRRCLTVGSIGRVTLYKEK